MPQKEAETNGNNPGPSGDKKDEEIVIYDRTFFKKNNVCYSSERPTAWNCIRILWCGCAEPTQHITTKYIKENRWKGCARETNSLAMENIYDVRRQQTLCFVCLNGLPCCACCNDMGDIVLYVTDETERLSSGKHSQWLLVDVANSLKVHERLTAHLQTLHADWRKTGRQMGRKLKQVEK
ncbi:hypothetical protein RFI_09385 [Reticulomyxa filosa]|uniref:Uncharacterized protein n=1 Tax=Reticulomyxa filosa TaxID=46433 RepID=X6NP97_RETFI|nr:hypothetical protein RFI_09385 [Reticulomyxa filosa]|eukprot:ETO27748.1 hypothetical protein RFI_09385 [Reticulomyxa filosa]